MRLAPRDRGRPRPSRCRAWGFVRAGSLPGSAYSDRCGRREASVGADAPGPGQSAGQAHAATWRVVRRAGARGARCQRVRRQRRAAASCGPRTGLRRRLQKAPGQCLRSRLSLRSTFRLMRCCRFPHRSSGISSVCVPCRRSPQLWCYAVSRGSSPPRVGPLELRLLSTRRFRSPRPAGCLAPVASAAPGRAASAARRCRGFPRAGRRARAGGGCPSAPG